MTGKVKYMLAPGLALLIALASNFNIFAQSDKAKKTENKTGYVKYMWDLTANLKYPLAAESRKVIGMSVTRITLDNEGKVTASETVNSLDKSIDQAVIEALNKLSFKWLLRDTAVTGHNFFIQVAFILDDGPKEFFFKSAWPCKKNFLKPVAIYGFPYMHGEYAYKPPEDVDLSTQCTEQFNAGNFANALRLADEMIKRYPYTKQLYQLRILIERKLFFSDLVARDANKISNFANGLSLDSLLQEY
jgi:TonB family protein